MEKHTAHCFHAMFSLYLIHAYECTAFYFDEDMSLSQQMKCIDRCVLHMYKHDMNPLCHWYLLLNKFQILLFHNLNIISMSTVFMFKRLYLFH